MIEVGEERRRRQKKLARDSRGPTDGVVMFDGKPCAGWIADHLKTVRDAGRWDGWLVSGFRTPEYSEHLCYDMCGRPSCPGKCAGRSTNHAKYRNPEGAVDLSDYARFGQECVRLGIPLHNALGPADPVHYSTSGR